MEINSKIKEVLLTTVHDSDESISKATERIGQIITQLSDSLCQLVEFTLATIESVLMLKSSTKTEIHRQATTAQSAISVIKSKKLTVDEDFLRLSEIIKNHEENVHS